MLEFLLTGMNKNKHLAKICVGPAESIKTALQHLTTNKPGKTLIPQGIVLVVDKKDKLLGVATDGDIRRALSRGVSLESAISKIMNKNPFVIEGAKSNTEILSLVAEKNRKEGWRDNRLNKIIVVDEERRVMDLVSFYDLWQRSDTRFKQIGVLGLGYVGLTLALTLADLGFQVRGFDINEDVRLSLTKGKPHFFEEGIHQILKDNLGKNFKVVENFQGNNNCDIYFVAVGTPLRANKEPNLEYLENASVRIGKVLKSGDAVILRSTVPVGTTRGFVIPILEKHSGLRAGKDFFVAFAPERTIEGKALRELRTLPQVIGGIDKSSTDLTASVFNHMTHSTILVDSLEEAEVVKLINNTYRDVHFAFSNELSLICHQLGIDTHRVIEAANRDYERSNVPLPSPGVGGACLEKDPFILLHGVKTKNPSLVRHARTISDTMVNFVADTTISFLKEKNPATKNPKVLILGFAFKGRPVTSDMRGSTTIPLVKKLQKTTKNIYGYDPAVKHSDITGLKVKHAPDLKKGFEGADAVIVMNNNPAFEELNIRQLLSLANKPCFLFDTWGLYSMAEIKKVRYASYKRL